MSTINFFGIASGLNTGSLVSSIIERSRATRVKPLEDKISDFQETNSSLSTLTSKLKNLKEAADAFRAINGGAISKVVSSSDESVITASATNGASNSSTSISVSQVASNATLSFENTYSSKDAALNNAVSNGTISFNVGTGAGQESFSLNVNSTTSLADFVSAFNSASEKAVASTVNLGSESNPQYKVVISSLNEGTEKGQISVTDAAAVFSGHTIDQATNAEFSISGIAGTISRSSNTVSDIIEGVTFNISKVGTTTLSVKSDVSSSGETFESFVNAYNDLYKFIKEEDAISFEAEKGETRAIFGSLSNTSVDENTLSAVKSVLSRSGSGGGSVAILADLGITTQRDGTLKFDKEVFEKALSSDPESVRDLASTVGENLASVNGTIDQFTRFNGLIDISINRNKNSIGSLQSRISDLEKNLSRQEESLIARFAKLETQLGKLQSQQSVLNAFL